MDSNVLFYSISALLALIPALIWLSTIFTKTKGKKVQILVFLLSIFSVIPIFILQFFLEIFPQFDVVKFFETQIHNQNIYYIIAFIGVGIIEEIVKQLIVRVIDRKYLLIETINESIRFSLIAALGFSFAENILYFYHIWMSFGMKDLFIAYVFRSIFTTCAHLIFSGFFGYYYGLAKFSLEIREQSRWTGKKLFLANFMARFLNIAPSESLKQILIVKGLLLGVVMHAVFNFLLQLNQVAPVVVFIASGYYFLQKLLSQKAGHLILITDLEARRSSTMASSDEEVVIELLGMWFKEQKYVDVIHICERLLKRDPDNKVVQLFKAQAMDKMENNNIYGQILEKLFPPKKVYSLAELEKMKKQQQINNQSNAAK